MHQQIRCAIILPAMQKASPRGRWSQAPGKARPQRRASVLRVGNRQVRTQGFWHKCCRHSGTRLPSGPLRTASRRSRSSKSCQRSKAMGAIPLPTDSIQRRHFAQLAATLDLPSPPEDSVLRRHYEQLFTSRSARHASAHDASGKATPARAAAPAKAPARSSAAPQPASASVSPIRAAAHAARPATTSAPAAPAAPQGFFSRLFAKLFG